MKSLNLAQAQKLALLSQGLPLTSNKGSAKAKTLAVFEQLGYVQIDTISVVQRAHHHTLWSRNPSYQLEHLDQLVQKRKSSNIGLMQRRIYLCRNTVIAYLAKRRSNPISRSIGIKKTTT